LIDLAVSFLVESNARCWRIQMSKIGNERPRLFTAHGKPLLRRFAVNAALDLEEHADTTCSFAGDRRLSLVSPGRQTSSGRGSSRPLQGSDQPLDFQPAGGDFALGQGQLFALRKDHRVRSGKVGGKRIRGHLHDDDPTIFLIG
jgi:hypothetical protein